MRTAGRIRDADLEEVRRRANLIDVASEYMQVKRAGRLYKALCPFHAEKTPSFSLDPAKGLYFCFGCHEGGDVIKLVEKLDNLSFVEAIERLAQMTGVDLHYEQLSDADRAAHRRRARLVDAHREAAAYYHETLKRASEASDARAYLLQQRGFTKETLELFQVGFSLPKWDALVTHLKGKGFSEQEIADAGLGARRQDGGLVDRFRGRVMFPIHDLTGDPVAFGARKMGTEDGPKYLNSAESPIYKKSQVLYALNRANRENRPGSDRRGVHRRDRAPPGRDPDGGGDVRDRARSRAPARAPALHAGRRPLPRCGRGRRSGGGADVRPDDR
ncbi:MAG: hypothetical protein E6G46_11920 [Actinobacteria bacterium]|nr:MAG: hypothetical protein E6G46_11920 [Actinomycetota bacterium]